MMKSDGEDLIAHITQERHLLRNNLPNNRWVAINGDRFNHYPLIGIAKVYALDDINFHRCRWSFRGAIR